VFMPAQSRPLPLLLTRPLLQAERFVAELPGSLRARVDPILAPLIRIVALGKADVAGVRGVILTSENALSGLNPGRGLPAYCIGPRTTAGARALGYDGQDCGGCADSLVSTLIARRVDGPLIHLRGTHTRGQVASRLTDAGVRCSEAEVYDQRAEKIPDNLRDALSRGQPMLVPLFSPRTARLFASDCPNAAGAEVFCLSPSVALGLGKNRYHSVTICDAPTARSMTEAINCRVCEGSIEPSGSSS